MEFTSANEVRAFLRERGVTDPFSIRRVYSPFSGKMYFAVQFPVPKGISVITDSGSRVPTSFVSSDDNKLAERLQEIHQLLLHTNAILIPKTMEA